MRHPVLDHWSEISTQAAPELFRPKNVDALQKLLQSESGACLLGGNGSKWWLGNTTYPVRFCVDLRGLDRVIDYSPGDLTVTVQAGMPAATLGGVLAEHGQTLAVDPPMSGKDSVGGMIAVGISGPLQQQYGTLRDKVLGMTVMLADGTITKAGGKVVKNVAGYDLCKLYTASMGTLAVILEVTLRVFPLWQKTRSFTLPAKDRRESKEIFLELRRLEVQPAGVVFLQAKEQQPVLAIRFLGGEGAVDDQLARLMNRFPEGQVESGDLVAAAVASFYNAPVPVRLRAESLLSSIADAAEEIGSEIDSTGSILDFSSRRYCVAAAAVSAETLQAVRSKLRRLDAALIVEKAPLDLKQQIDVWGSSRGDLALAKKIRATLDPQGRFNPGIYVAGV